MATPTSKRTICVQRDSLDDIKPAVLRRFGDLLEEELVRHEAEYWGVPHVQPVPSGVGPIIDITAEKGD